MNQRFRETTTICVVLVPEVSLPLHFSRLEESDEVTRSQTFTDIATEAFTPSEVEEAYPTFDITQFKAKREVKVAM